MRTRAGPSIVSCTSAINIEVLCWGSRKSKSKFQINDWHQIEYWQLEYEATSNGCRNDGGESRLLEPEIGIACICCEPMTSLEHASSLSMGRLLLVHRLGDPLEPRRTKRASSSVRPARVQSSDIHP